MSVVMPDSFIFCEELRRELQFLLDNPKCIPSPLCFYGLPGVGKTMFSKFLAKTVSNHTMYRDMNEYKEPRPSSRCYTRLRMRVLPILSNSKEMMTESGSGQSLWMNGTTRLRVNKMPIRFRLKLTQRTTALYSFSASIHPPKRDLKMYYPLQ